MKLRYAPRAKADIAEIHTYINDHNSKAAKPVIRRIKSTAGLLSQYPGLGRITDIPGVRVLPAAPDPRRNGRDCNGGLSFDFRRNFAHQYRII